MINSEAQALGVLMMKLLNWYKSQCNGDWEHSYGIKIDTLDNPGWDVTIDLLETKWEHIVGRIGPAEIDEVYWAIGEIKNGQFNGTGGLANFSQILEIFFQLIEES